MGEIYLYLKCFYKQRTLWRFQSSWIWHCITGRPVCHVGRIVVLSSSGWRAPLWSFFETSGRPRPTTQHDIPEECNLQQNRCENLKYRGVSYNAPTTLFTGVPTWFHPLSHIFHNSSLNVMSYDWLADWLTDCHWVESFLRVERFLN